MELPTGYRLRSPRPRDAVEVAAVVTAHDIADFGEPDFTEDDLLDDWERPRFELDRDAWVIVGPTGRIVGYAFVWAVEPGREFESDAFVFPEYAGRGLGGQLLDLVETRARELADPERGAELGLYASSANTGKRDLLTRRGFAPLHTRLRLTIDLGRLESIEGPPTGVVTRVFDPDSDVEAVRSVMQEAFADLARFSRRRLDEWLALRVRHPAFDPALWRVAVDETGSIIGAILVYDVGGTGYVSNLGVRRAWQRRGVGQGLLAAAFAALRDQGQMRVVVEVAFGDSEGARRLYESVGMRVAEHHDWFAKALAGWPELG
ncbi:MAG TPA: GNAT family N-acetyltransferase [Acidimicrobiia bacterium]|nr:GNAT family N-acetyltransferase [Acidimicrobiia bacterium]